MEVYEISEQEQPALLQVFKEKCQAKEDQYRDRLAKEGIKLPLASNFVYGNAETARIYGSPDDRLPNWVKKILMDAWNEALKDNFDSRQEEQSSPAISQ